MARPRADPASLAQTLVAFPAVVLLSSGAILGITDPFASAWTANRSSRRRRARRFRR
jgi:hypothetical protein